MTKIYNSKFGSAQVFEDTDTGHLRLVDPDTGWIVSDVGVDRSFIVGDPIGYEYGDEGDLGLLREKPVEEETDDLFDEMRSYMRMPDAKGKTAITKAEKDVRISIGKVHKDRNGRSVSICIRKNINDYFELDFPYTVYPRSTELRIYFWRQENRGAGRCKFIPWPSDTYIGYFKGNLPELQKLLSSSKILPDLETDSDTWEDEFCIHWDNKYNLPYIDLREVKADE